jgi:hypothetical protein
MRSRVDHFGTFHLEKEMAVTYSLGTCHSAIRLSVVVSGLENT